MADLTETTTPDEEAELLLLVEHISETAKMTLRRILFERDALQQRVGEFVAERNPLVVADLEREIADLKLERDQLRQQSRLYYHADGTTSEHEPEEVIRMRRAAASRLPEMDPN